MIEEKGQEAKGNQQGADAVDSSSQTPDPSAVKKSWPLSWILIVILAYIGLQTAFFLFFSK